MSIGRARHSRRCAHRQSQLVATIAGYTDTVGTNNRQPDPVRQSAQSVFQYLTVTKGIAAARLTQLGFGETTWPCRPPIPPPSR